MAGPSSLRVAEGEEVRFSAGSPGAAELWSRGRLPLRVRTESRHHARPEFPGTAVVVRDATYEVVSETERPDEGRFVYALRPWPEGEVTRGRVVYGPAFVRAAEEERARERLRARVRPWRHLLYPIVGLLPEEQQERVCERLGLYSVSATLVSGLCEGLGVLVLVALVAPHADPGLQILLVVGAPGLMLLMLPGLGRAAGAALFRETAGSPLLGHLAGTLDAFREARPRHDAAVLPLTRRTFWERLARPDAVEDRGSSRVHRGLLPHIGWTPNRTLLAGADYWKVVSEEAAVEQGRVSYVYVLEPQGDEAAEGSGPPRPPAPTAYADEVLAGIRDDWDDFNRGFGWLTTLFARDVQGRAFDHHGGPAAAARATRATAAVEALLGAYLLSFLPGGPAADPVAPAAFVCGLALVGDGAVRFAASRAGRYAPSVLRFVLPVHLLRPERRPYEEHRAAERATREALRAGDAES
ncbi:MAG: hypothetical protein U0599_14945 [Vicinamibacteria bacterium]